MPPRKHRIQVVLAQPETVLPKKLPTTAQMMPKKLSAATTSPRDVISRMGLMDRLVMPSKASISIFFRG